MILVCIISSFNVIIKFNFKNDFIYQSIVWVKTDNYQSDLSVCIPKDVRIIIKAVYPFVSMFGIKISNLSFNSHKVNRNL